MSAAAEDLGEVALAAELVVAGPGISRDDAGMLSNFAGGNEDTWFVMSSKSTRARADRDRLVAAGFLEVAASNTMGEKLYRTSALGRAVLNRYQAMGWLPEFVVRLVPQKLRAPK